MKYAVIFFTALAIPMPLAYSFQTKRSLFITSILATPAAGFLTKYVYNKYKASEKNLAQLKDKETSAESNPDLLKKIRNERLKKFGFGLTTIGSAILTTGFAIAIYKNRPRKYWTYNEAREFALGFISVPLKALGYFSPSKDQKPSPSLPPLPASSPVSDQQNRIPDNVESLPDPKRRNAPFSLSTYKERINLNPSSNG